MTFSEALNHIRHGRKPVRRAGWPVDHFINLGGATDLAVTFYTGECVSGYWNNLPADLLADDWELYFHDKVENYAG